MYYQVMRHLFNSKTPLILALLLAESAIPAFADGHGEAGAQVFRRCAGCHEIGPDARNKVGPPLNDILGAPIARAEGFRYSRTMQEANEDGMIWAEDMLLGFFERPADLFPGTRMSFSGVRSEQERQDLLIFLSTLTPETNMGSANLEPSDPRPSDDILAIEGNVEYGEYLSGTCVTCHQLSGSDDGIPSIMGWPNAAFVTVLHAYKNKNRDNSVMQQITSVLSNDEIAALAAYYETIAP